MNPAIDNSWQPLKVGAGGWLTGIDIAPDDTMVVRTDTYGAYIWNGAQWHQLVTSTSMPTEDVAQGNNQGVYEIQIAPSNTNILYMEYLGGVYRSDDRGASWSTTAFAHVTEDPNDPYRMNGQKMAVDPHNPNLVYVGTPQNGLFVTTDGGTSWHAVNVPVSSQDSQGLFPGITGIAFDPTSGVTDGKTNVIYAASYGHGVYESTDGGVSWSPLSGGPSDVEYATVSTNGTYYAVGANNTELWRHTNGSWTELLVDSNNGIHTVTTDPFNPDRIVVATPGGSLNESMDGGATWSGSNWAAQFSATDVPWLGNTGQYMSIGGMLFDQLVPNKVWASDGIGVWDTSVPQDLQWNTPITWNSQSAGIEQLVANDIVVPPGGHPILASWDRAFVYVTNPDEYPSTYGPVDGKFSMGWSLDYASSNPSFIVGIADWWGVEQSGYSTNGGQTWNVFPNMPSFAGKTIGGSIAASSPSDIVWAPADGLQPEYTVNGGVTWSPVVLPGVSDWHDFHWAYYLDATHVTADRVLADTFYLYFAGNGVYRSADGGGTWTQAFSGEISPFSGYNSELQSVPGEAGNLFFTGGPQGVASHPADEGFFRSTDGGVSWTAVANVREVQTFGFGAPAASGDYPSIYIVGWVNSIYGVWQSNDDAQSWTQIGTWPTGSLDQIKTIAGDPNVYGQVYVGFNGSGYAYLPAVPVNHAPVATDDVAGTQQNTVIDINVLANDTDPDGNALSISGMPTALHGTVTVNNDGTLNYTPTTNYAGSDTIDYAVTDGSLSATGHVAMTVTGIVGVTITGTKGGDIIDATHTPSGRAFVSNGNDSVHGLAGNDVIHGDGGDDTLNGGARKDTLYGDAGNDTLIGGTGRDLLFGDDGNDSFLVSGAADASDVFNGGAGADAILVAGTRALMLSGFNALNSSIEIWQGNDQAVLGTRGANVFDLSGLQFVSGINYINAGAGNDTIIGSPFNDDLRGGKGNDQLTGGQGNDVLTGRAGNDAFVFGSDSGHDTITDFAAGPGIGDVIKFDPGTFADFAAVLKSATQVGTSVVISYGESNTLTLSHMIIAKLNADDFQLTASLGQASGGVIHDQSSSPREQYIDHGHLHHTDLWLL